MDIIFWNSIMRFCCASALTTNMEAIVKISKTLWIKILVFIFVLQFNVAKIHFVALSSKYLGYSARICDHYTR